MTAALRRRHLAQHLHQLGPRAVAELLADIGAERNITTTSIDEKLSRYSKLDRAILQALGADRLPPVPMHVVGGRRT